MKENSIGDRIEEKYTRYINCETDILELTIEETIFILEKDASVHYVEDLLQEAYKVILSDYKRVLQENKYMHNELDKQQTKINKYAKENEELNLKYYMLYTGKIENLKAQEVKIKSQVIPVQTVKDIIDRIDYDIKKTKEIISKNTNIYASYRKNDYQIVRLKAMNTKSLDIKKRLQKLLESEE